MTREDDDDDRVGYGKPPKRTRFRPGQSGNPDDRARSISRIGRIPSKSTLRVPKTQTRT